HVESNLNKIGDVTGNKPVGEDIVSYYQSREVNLTPDWKRKFAPDGSSVPFDSMNEWKYCRLAIDRNPQQAWPDMIELNRDTRYSKKTVQTIKRLVLHRIAKNVPGFRLPKDMSARQACWKLGLSPNAIAKLKEEKLGWTELPEHPEVDRIRE